MRHVLFILGAIAIITISSVGAQTPSTISALPTNTAPPASSYLMLDNGSNLYKSTVTVAVQAEIPNAPSPEPSCVISAGTCSVNVAVTGGVVHECTGNTDSGDTNGPFVVSGAPSPVPSAAAGWHFTVTQPTATSTPTVHIHAVCR